ncbi:MAG: CAAD domain-containing protein [Prochlorococcaceae cyanobacterium ETNP18_MAG_14]|nr:CAAD domain-containing protein [Prochlorococcaceae cyanobacterium ETNP18_MAG_14]
MSPAEESKLEGTSGATEGAESSSESTSSSAAKSEFSAEPADLAATSSAVPKTSTQQQAAPETPPAQSNPPISKPTTIPASQAPIPNQEQNKVGKEVDWPLLAGKARDLLNLSNWIKPNDQSNQWQQLRQILVFVAWPIALVIFVRIYGGILSTIESVPLASSLFEMAGIIWLAWFSLTRLIRSKDRQDVISSLRSRWHAFSGSKEKPDSPSRDTVAPPQ